MAQAEDMIDRAGGIGRMFADDQLAFMVEQAVEDVEAAARANENVLRFTEGLSIRKVIVVPGRMVNIVP